MDDVRVRRGGRVIIMEKGQEKFIEARDRRTTILMGIGGLEILLTPAEGRAFALLIIEACRRVEKRIADETVK